MALPLGKLSLIIGAGLVGSILAKEGHMSNMPDFLTGALKIAWKQLKQKDSASSSSKPKNDSLLQQVNNLRQELQLLASNRSIMIVTGDRSGSGRYVVIVVVLVGGYGYLWWKGWRLGDMMFATRRGLNDACTSVAKQLENVYSSISATKRHLSSSLDRVDCKIDECADNTTATKEEVSELRGDVKLIGADVQSVHHVVRSLETKIIRLEGRQNETNIGVGQLVAFVRNIENGKKVEQIEGGSSRPALELRPPFSPSRTVSLPSSNNNSVETNPSPPAASNEYQRKQDQRFVPTAISSVSASGLKSLESFRILELHDTCDDGVGDVPSSISASHASEERISNDKDSAGSGFLGRKFTNIGASFLTRSRSATQSFK